MGISTIENVVKGHTSFKHVSKNWNILLTSLLNHLNGRTITRKMGLQGVLTNEEDGAIVAWNFNMQMVGLSITLQQFKLKVLKSHKLDPCHSKMIFKEVVGDIS
jgi:hypothetical protein